MAGRSGEPGRPAATALIKPKRETMKEGHRFEAEFIPVEELTRAAARHRVCRARVVIGQDRATDGTTAFFGKEDLERWAAGGRGEQPRTVVIRYDCFTPQLDYLAMAVHRLKGSCCLPGVDRAAGAADARQPVRLYDADLARAVTVPAGELAEGMIQVQLVGPDEPAGRVWVDQSRFKCGTAKRSQVGGRLRKRIKAIRRALAEVRPLTTREWAEGFERDVHPKHEVAVWEHLAACYTALAADHADAGERAEVLRVGVRATMTAPGLAGMTITSRVLPERRVREIAAYVQETWDTSDWPPPPAGRGDD